VGFNLLWFTSFPYSQVLLLIPDQAIKLPFGEQSDSFSILLWEIPQLSIERGPRLRVSVFNRYESVGRHNAEVTVMRHETRDAIHVLESFNELGRRVLVKPIAQEHMALAGRNVERDAAIAPRPFPHGKVKLEIVIRGEPNDTIGRMRNATGLYPLSQNVIEVVPPREVKQDH
jgi:hypothetical protein